MGYRPDAMASALVHKRVQCTVRPVSAALAWINRWDDPRQLRRYREFELYWQGASRAAAEKGFRLEEFFVGRELSFRSLDRILKSRNIQGVLVPPHGRQAGHCPDKASLDWSRYAVVKFGYSISELPAHIVAGNHVQGVMNAFSKIRERGYRRVGYLCHAQSSIRGRAGFLMHQMNLPPEERLPILELADAPEKTPGHLERWLEKNAPDAILSEVAGLPALLEKLGVRVPQDVALAATSVLDGNIDAGIYQNSEQPSSRCRF